MHPRQRSPANGYRSMNMVMGPEGSTKGFHREASFGRGRLSNPNKSFSHPNSSRKGDIFMEAGRLAAEYLVSQGLLPPNVLSLKWHNASSGSFKKHNLDGDALQAPSEGRTSVLARLGNMVPDGSSSSGRRKLGFDDFNQKGRRRGSFRSNGFDSGREFKRSSSWYDRPRAYSPDIKDNDDTVTRQQDEEQQQQQLQVGGSGAVDNVLQKSNSNEFVPRSEDGDNLDTGTDKDRISSDLDLKESSSGAPKDTYGTEVEFVKSSVDLENISDGVREVKDSTCDDDKEKSSMSKNLYIPSGAQENHASSSICTDLVALCKSFKVPTRTRSSLAGRNLKVDRHRNNEHERTHDIRGLQGPEISAENESVKGSSSGDMLPDKTIDLEHLDSDIAKVEPVNAAKNINIIELDTACNAEDEDIKTFRAESCQDRAYMHDNNQESSATLPEYGSCSSMVEERGEKRVVEDDDVREDSKRVREWLPFPRTEDYFLHNNSIGMKKSSGEDEISPIDEVTMTSAQRSLMSSPQFTQGGDRPFLQCSEEKQSLPNSFRTCDLNLIEVSEVHENHVNRPILIYPPVSEAKKGTVPVDIDLSMSHASVSSEFSTHATSGKEIEVIDLENDSIQEGNSIDNMERKTETTFPGLEGFSNHAQNTADIHDTQDGYGLMISELLGNDFPNCSSVPDDINSVHNEMGLHNGTGTLGEDDSIYMSLGEIPLSFLRAWEQPPPQEYQKPF